MPVKALRNFDWLFFFTLLALTGLGIAFIWSSTHWVDSRDSMAAQQLRWMGLSVLVLLVVAAVDYTKLAPLAYVGYALALLSLVLVMLIGVERNYARRWIQLPGFMVQPSEPAKIAVILALAYYLRYRRNCRTLSGLIVPLLIVLVPMALILRQPDLGTALVLLPALFAMLYAAGASVRHLGVVVAAGIAAAPMMWFTVMGQAQKGRILGFLWPHSDPYGTGWHVRQSLAAVVSGGLFGKGFSSGSPVLLNRGFASHTDFIFAVIAHEWGFVGSMLVVLLLFMFFSRGLEIAGATREPFGRLVVVGLLATLAFQAVVNVAMTIRLCPITGVTLPFVSYGGSSLLVSYVMAGLILNVGMRRKATVAPDDFS